MRTLHLPSLRTSRRLRTMLATGASLLLVVPQACLAIDPLHPLGTGFTLELIIGRFVSVILGLMGTLSLAVFVYGGIVWMTAQGNEEKIKKAKNTIVYAALGIIVAFTSYTILTFIMKEVLAKRAGT